MFSKQDEQCLAKLEAQGAKNSTGCLSHKLEGKRVSLLHLKNAPKKTQTIASSLTLILSLQSTQSNFVISQIPFLVTKRVKTSRQASHSHPSHPISQRILHNQLHVMPVNLERDKTFVEEDDAIKSHINEILDDYNIDDDKCTPDSDKDPDDAALVNIIPETPKKLMQQ
ncbi:hypothetical protein BC830DRAFT_395731 [Chytriomyces sp. MP71]|nr:hypothetical protein BC830DRAFT_395731 [Chytriomyces sp. MP71]